MVLSTMRLSCMANVTTRKCHLSQSVPTIPGQTSGTVVGKLHTKLFVGMLYSTILALRKIP